MLARYSLTAWALVFSALLTASSWSSEPTGKQYTDVELGRELFLRTWQRNDARSQGGDGLGPLFNDVSCVSCHNQGAVGGGGSIEKNVLLISAFANPALPKESAPRVLDASLHDLHPGFENSRSVLIHLDGDDRYTAWRENLLPPEAFSDVATHSLPRFAVVGSGWNAQRIPIQLVAPQPSPPFPAAMIGKAQQLNDRFNEVITSTRDNFQLTMSTRNSTALFGIGSIDRIPDEVIREGALKSFSKFPGITGRVCDLGNGKIGRFGWKAQIATLERFVLTACANELGLEVPGHAQAMSPTERNYRAPGYDMSPAECEALVGFVRLLPKPEMAATRDQAAGATLFNNVGCSLCHVAKLGEVEGIYSDLLLHDMGPELSAAGFYDSFVPNTTEQEELNAEQIDPFGSIPDEDSPQGQPVVGARNREWRTPPLWGVRDSAPYLHDGRAATIEEAIFMHGGEAQKSAQKYLNLSPAKKRQLRAFLQSLVAPYPDRVHTRVAKRD